MQNPLFKRGGNNDNGILFCLLDAVQGLGFGDMCLFCIEIFRVFKLRCKQT